MHECIRRKVHLTYSSNKSWKGFILGIRFIKNTDLAAFSKDFLLLNNRKQTMRTKRVCPKLSDLGIWCEGSLYRSKSTDQLSLDTYLPDIKVKRYRTCRADRKCFSEEKYFRSVLEKKIYRMLLDLVIVPTFFASVWCKPNHILRNVKDITNSFLDFSLDFKELERDKLKKSENKLYRSLFYTVELELEQCMLYLRSFLL